MSGHGGLLGRGVDDTPLSLRPVPARLRSGIGSVSGPLTRADTGSTVRHGYRRARPAPGRRPGERPQSAGPGRALGAGRAGRRARQHRGPGRRAVGRGPASHVVEGTAGLCGAAAQAAGQRRHRVGGLRLPPRPHRRRAGPPGVRATARARTGGAGGRRPGAGVVPGPGGPAAVAWTGLAGPGGVGAGTGGDHPARGPADGRRRAAGRGRDRAGRAHEVVEQARALVAQAPFRERRWALLARALHQAGRQPEALGAIKRAREMLVEEFGSIPAGSWSNSKPCCCGRTRHCRPRPHRRSGRPVPTAACCPTTPPTRTRSSVARTTSPPACAGCATRACSP